MSVEQDLIDKDKREQEEEGRRRRRVTAFLPFIAAQAIVVWDFADASKPSVLSLHAGWVVGFMCWVAVTGLLYWFIWRLVEYHIHS